MTSVMEIAAPAAAVIYVIATQVRGQALQGKRLVLLPGVMIASRLAARATRAGMTFAL